MTYFFRWDVHTDKTLFSKANESRICRANRTHEVGHEGHEFQRCMYLLEALWQLDGAYQLGRHHRHSNSACMHVLTNMWQFFLKLYSNQYLIFGFLVYNLVPSERVGQPFTWTSRFVPGTRYGWRVAITADKRFHSSLDAFFNSGSCAYL